MKISKYVLIVMILITSIILGLRISNFLSSLTTVDYEYNTIYTRIYMEDKFNDSLIGKTKYEIVKILGESFEKTKLDSFNAIIYTDKKDKDRCIMFDFSS